MSDRRRICLAVLAGLALCAALALAQDWPQWRGPARTGAAVDFKAPAAWPDRPKQIWKVQAGAGHASPIVASGRVFLFSRMGEQEAVSARDLGTGKEIWRAAYDAPYQMNPAATSHGKGPKSTPAHDRGRLFTFGISGILSAWQAQDGRLLWRRDFKKEFPSTAPDFGVAMSPIVVGDLVIVHAGGIGNGAVLALDVVERGDEVVMEGRRSRVRVADRRRLRWHAADRHAVAEARDRVVARRWPAVLGDPVRDRLRAEQRHADRREGPRHLRRPQQADDRRARQRGRREVADLRPRGRMPICRCI